MKYIEVPCSQFKKDFKLAMRQRKDMSKLQEVLDKIKNGEALEEKYKEHYLTNNYKGCLECHIQPDWLLIYKLDIKEGKLYLIRTGSHTELFDEDFTLEELDNLFKSALED